MESYRFLNIAITMALVMVPGFAAITLLGLAWLCHIVGESWTMPLEVVLICGSAWMIHGCRLIWAERKFIEEVDDEEA